MNTESNHRPPLPEASVRRLAYERGLRLTKARGFDRYALEHPDGRVSAYQALDTIERALHSTGAVVVDGEDFGSRFVWLCGTHHGTGPENFARLRAEARGDTYVPPSERPIPAVLRTDRLAFLTTAGELVAIDLTQPGDAAALARVRQWLATYPPTPAGTEVGPADDMEMHLVTFLRRLVDGAPS